MAHVEPLGEHPLEKSVKPKEEKKTSRNVQGIALFCVILTAFQVPSRSTHD